MVNCWVTLITLSTVLATQSRMRRLFTRVLSLFFTTLMDRMFTRRMVTSVVSATAMTCTGGLLTMIEWEKVMLLLFMMRLLCITMRPLTKCQDSRSSLLLYP